LPLLLSFWPREATDSVRLWKKRNANSSINSFKAHWRTNQIEQHMTLMHKERWGEYSDLSGKDKGTFFSGPSQFIYANTLDAHMDVDTGALLSWLDKAIVSDVIGGMLFDPAESEEKREKALSILNGSTMVQVTRETTS
jgi:hypothetical protein